MPTDVIGGMHTLLWLPRALQMRRDLKAEEARKEAARSNGTRAEGESSAEEGHYAD